MSIAMSEHVWVNDMFRDSTLVPMMRVDIVDGENPRKDAARAGLKALKAGLPVSSEQCPQEIWAEPGKFTLQEKEQMPDLFNARGYWIISGKAASILRSFNLGKGALYPVNVYDTDRKSEFDGQYYCWVIGNSKSALSFDGSNGLFYPPDYSSPPTHRNPPFNMADDDIAVSSVALAGPDAWVDPTLFHSAFVSGSLGDALAEAGLKRAFRLRRARVIGDIPPVSG